MMRLITKMSRYPGADIIFQQLLSISSSITFLLPVTLTHFSGHRLISLFFKNYFYLAGSYCVERSGGSRLRNFTLCWCIMLLVCTNYNTNVLMRKKTKIVKKRFHTLFYICFKMLKCTSSFTYICGTFHLF